MSKKIKNKVDCFVRILNESNPEKYIKSKFNDFILDFIYAMENENSENDSPYLIEPDYLDLLEQSKKVETFSKIEPSRDLFFIFGIFVFRSYIRYSIKISKLTQNNMVRFVESIENEIFSEQNLKKLEEYFLYFKRKGNESLEKQEIENLNKRFYFIKDLMQFDLKMPISEDSELSKETLNAFFSQSYQVFMEAVMLNFSNLLNFLNGLVLV